jgi:hypothetical protein
MRADAALLLLLSSLAAGSAGCRPAEPPADQPTSETSQPAPARTGIEALLDSDFPSWEWVKVRQRDLDLLKEQTAEPSHVTGDFNGDGVDDHAAQILHPGEGGATTYTLAAYLSGNGRFEKKILDRFPTEGGELGIILLPAAKGQEVYDYEANRKFPLEHDAFTVVLSEKTSSVWILEGGELRRVLMSD